MWFIAAGVWVVVFGAGGVVVASLLGIDPLVGFASSVVLGPLGWLTMAFTQAAKHLGANQQLPDPVGWVRSTANLKTTQRRDGQDGSWRL
jgi:hypothetical protein